MSTLDTAPATDGSARTGDERLPGPDLVRAVALIGVVLMNYHAFLVSRAGTDARGTVARFFDPWAGPLSTRFAATFVLVAGVGVTLFTGRTRATPISPAELSARRWTLARRGLTLYGFGLLFAMIWPGTILVYYGAMFVVGAVIVTWRTRWIVATGAFAACAGAAIAWWALTQRHDGRDTSWLTDPPSRSPRGVLLNVLVNGTHPLLPWLAFFCVGIALGRALRTRWWRRAAIGGGLSMFAVATVASSSLHRGDTWPVVASTDPFDRGLLYTASALGTALVAFGAITWLADRYGETAPIELLRDAGAMSLTLYIAHALVFNLLVDWFGWIRPTGLDTALVVTAGFWIAAILAAAAWHRRVGIGPAEWLYRRLGG
ncbi:MAG: DUF418 domain-containing protein [Ilumatobacteraceae bacterium]